MLLNYWMGKMTKTYERRIDYYEKTNYLSLRYSITIWSLPVHCAH